MKIVTDYTDYSLLLELELEASEKYRDVGYDPSEWTVNNIETFKSYCQKGMLWVAEESEEPIGFVLMDYFGKYAHIEELDVSPRHMRRGVATALIDSAIVRAHTDKKMHISLRTFKTTPWSVNLYNKCGFAKIDHSEFSYLDLHVSSEMKVGLPMEDRITMIKVF